MTSGEIDVVTYFGYNVNIVNIHNKLKDDMIIGGELCRHTLMLYAHI